MADKFKRLQDRYSRVSQAERELRAENAAMRRLLHDVQATQLQGHRGRAVWERVNCMLATSPPGRARHQPQSVRITEK